jgi:hypothetical protein
VQLPSDIGRPSLTVRPVVHTDHLAEWLAVFRALGAGTLSKDPMWTELQLDRGRVTLTALNRDATEGEVSLGFETPDLAAYGAAICPVDGMMVEPFVTEDYESLRVVGRDGMDFLVDELIPGPAVPVAAATSVRAVWLTPEVEQAARDLESLGLRRTTAVDGPGIDLSAAEGDVLVRTSHGGPVAADVAVGVADLEAARRALLRAGIAHETGDHELHVSIPGDGGGRLRIVGEDRAGCSAGGA